MKAMLTLMMALISSNVFAGTTCPNLEGRYPKCKSEIRDIRGEYIVEQYMKDDVNFYQIHYIDDDTDENRTDAIRTDGKLESRKEKLPRVGIKVRIDSKSRCETDAVVSDADVYFMGAKVGQFVAKIYREGGTLYSNLDGKYLGKPLSKRIVCTQE
ncbi:hypothetical protein DOM21_03080 [Bacteriovorax stolpii]|uniref:Uncharacterized protein n=1 Tax=Bacteriovorax stolpii TaxID=960 RepID=A0A2K9NVM5_BACTC|nr:hypothetical protein [Bacteriovorax stolpii]AUN99550.1 hypothetical protein C0V70_15845 [Bacteriovorax stolpii]QDK40454.1 hypothetical protein DOM21_03080 [Bacteriovorax stolpii]TDP51179.1 hypothetical protein C8D79_3350 [Bacteriovorax stolpii]